MKFLQFISVTVEPLSQTNAKWSQRRRVKQVVAEVQADQQLHSTPRDNQVLPLALYPMANESGVGSGDPDSRPFDCDRGHLISLECGGPEASYNLVPMWGRFNQVGAWKQLEADMNVWVWSAGLKSTAHITIDCAYSTEDEEDPRIPIAFTVKAMVTAGFNQGKTNAWPMLEHNQPSPVCNPNPVLKQSLVNAQEEMGLSGWKIEEYIDWSNRPSYFKKPVFTPKIRPYAVLDYLKWKETLVQCNNDLDYAKRKFTETFQNKEFDTKRRQTIKDANRALNDGYLKSDDPQDWAYVDLRFRSLGCPPGVLLDNGGTDSAPQVDHIIPKSRTGVDAFSNAQLLSAAYNKFKRSQMSPADAELLTKTIFEGRLDEKDLKVVSEQMSKTSDSKKKALNSLKIQKEGPVKKKTEADLAHKTSLAKGAKK